MLHNRCEGFAKVDSRVLTEVTDNPSSLVLVEGAIEVEFMFENPFAKDDMSSVRNKPVARASTGLITFGRGSAARVALVSVSELSPCPGRAAIKKLAPVYACVMGVCLQLVTYAAWWSCMESIAIRRELQARPAHWCASWGRPKLADRAAEWGSVSSCSRSAALAIKHHVLIVVGEVKRNT
jgi:hypothetical protein